MLPDQAPAPEQEVALVEDQVSLELDPFATVLGLALKLTLGVGAETETVVDCEVLPPPPVQVSV